MGLIHLVNEVGELRGAHTHTHLNAGSSTYMNYTKKNHTIIMKATLQCTSCATPSINSFTTWLILVGWQWENYFPTGKPVAVPSFTEHITLVRLKKKKKKRSAILEQIALWQPRRVGFASIPIKTSTLENRAAENAAVRLGNLVS